MNIIKYFSFTFYLLMVLFFSCTKSSEVLQKQNSLINVYNEIAYYSKLTNDGGLIVLSSQFPIKSIYSNEDTIPTYLSKLNFNGEKSWTINLKSNFNNYNYLYPKTVVQTNDGGYVVIAQFSTTDPLNKHLLFIQMDATGNNILKKEIYPDGSWEGPYFELAQTTDNNFILADGNKIYKLNANGDKLWTYRNNFLFESHLLPTSDGGIIITSNNHSPETILRLKLNSSGDTLWQKFENDSNSIWRQTTIADISNLNFVIAGSSNASLDLDFYLEVFSDSGVSKKFYQIPGKLNEYCHSVLPTQDGGFLLIGTTTQSNDADNGILFDDEDFPDYNARMIAVKLDLNLNIKWTKTFGGNYGSKGLGINETPDGNFLLLGNQVSFSNPNVINMMVVKIKKDDTQ